LCVKELLYLLQMLCVISDFRREAHENCILLCYYAVRSENSLPMFRDNLSVPSSRLKNPKKSAILITIIVLFPLLMSNISGLMKSTLLSVMF